LKKNLDNNTDPLFDITK